MRDFTKGVLKFVGVVALLAAVVGGVLYGFYVRVVEVGHNAMAPTIMAGDQVLVWRGHEFDLGDIALCPHPTEPGRFVMGRVVGRGAQHVRMERGILYINNDAPDAEMEPAIRWVDTETGRTEQMLWGTLKILDHDARFFHRDSRSLPAFRDTRVPGGRVFLLSDNRSHLGEDSRAFGPVQVASCIGWVFMRLTAAPSPDEIGNGNLDLIE